MGPWPEFRGGADMAGRNPAARGPGGEGGQGEGLYGGQGNRFWGLAWEEEGRKGELHGELEDGGGNDGCRAATPSASRG